MSNLFASNAATLIASGYTETTFNSLPVATQQAVVSSLAAPAKATNPSEANVYLNIDVLIDGKPARISGIRLDSEYVQYLDKEHTKTNFVAASLLQTVLNKGVQASNENLEFSVTITKQGESSVLAETKDLF